MKLKELTGQLEIVSMTADENTEIKGISYDSRRTREGDLFVAIRGFETDGHRFIPAAIEKKAAVILCEVAPEGDVPYVQVRDSRLSLALCACAFYGNPASGMRMIGITGTSGKTSVSVLLKHVLEETRSAKVGLIGTMGNQIGDRLLPSEYTTPESLELQALFSRMKEEGCTHVVMEVSSHALELKRTAGILYDTAVYTNLSQDHLDFHGTMENYAAAKKKLFSACRSACVNADDSWAAFMTEGIACPVLTYGYDKTADLRAENPRFLPDRVCFETVCEGRRCETELKIPGTFSVQNALAVMAAAAAEGIQPEEAAAALRTAGGVKGRLESVPTDGNYSILVDYSHKPDALEKVLKSLRPTVTGRLICVFGCGGDRDRLKRPLMGKIAAEQSDFVIVTSDNPRTENPMAIIDGIVAGIPKSFDYVVEADRSKAIEIAILKANPEDVIMVVGKGHEDYQILGTEKIHFDDREQCKNSLNKKLARDLL